MRLRTFFVLLVPVFVACTGPEVSMDVDKKFAKVEPRRVQVYENKPIRPYVKLGEVKVENAENWDNVERIFRNRAAQIGGDAVIITGRDEYLKTEYEPAAYADFNTSPFYDPFGTGYTYGPNAWGYNFYYPNGFYLDTETLINAKGTIIKWKIE
jgi:hypothetical protein